MIDDEELKAELKAYAYEDHRVSEKAEAYHRFIRGPAGKDIPSLGYDDRGQTGRCCLHIEEIIRPKCGPPAPASSIQHIEEPEHACHCLDRAEEEIGAGKN